MSTDEPDAADLAEAFPHVAQLEQELKEADASVEELAEQGGTTRRDLLAGSAGLLGLGGILTAGSGTAQAGDDQVGSLGTDGNRLDAEIEDLDLTDQSSTPAGPGSGQVRFYAKNGSLYYKPAGGSETQVGGGGGTGIFEDTDSDGIYEQTTGTGIETPSVNTGELSGAHILDPEATDFGAALNTAAANADPGDTILIPPENYDHDTKAVIDKPLTIKGMGGGNAHDIVIKESNTQFTFPLINKTSDVELIEGGDDTGLRIENLAIDAEGVSNSTDFITVHGSSIVQNIVAFSGNQSGTVVHISQASTNDQPNNCRVANIWGSQTGPVIETSNTSGEAVNTNACVGENIIGDNCGGFIIDDAVGVGNSWHVQKGTTSSGIGDGAIRLGNMFNVGKCTYLENAEQDGAWVGIQQDDFTNAGIIIRGLATESADFNNVPFSNSAGMLQWRMGRNPMFNFHGPILTTKSGNQSNPSIGVGADSVGLYEDNGELYAVNSSGTDTQLT